jgi:hypothetical protein
MFDIPSKHPPTDTVKLAQEREQTEKATESPEKGTFYVCSPKNVPMINEVTATLASSIESTIEELVSRILADSSRRHPTPTTPDRRPGSARRLRARKRLPYRRTPHSHRSRRRTRRGCS